MSSKKIHRQWTRLRMVFHPHPAYLRRSTPTQPRTMGAEQSDVINCSIQKSLDQAAGGFSATLVPKQKYLDNINPNDWVEVFIDSEDQTSKVPLMVASIDRISRRRQVSSTGSTTEVISLSGRDYGKVFLSIMLIMDPLLGTIIDQTTFEQDVIVSKFTGNSISPLNRPDQVIDELLKRYHNGRAQCVPPESLLDNLAEYKRQLQASTFAATGDVATVLPGGLALRLGKVRGRTVLDGNPNLGGNLWSTMEQYINPVLNEMWVDTEGGLPTLHLEERPFSHDDFAKLNSVPVVETEVTQEDFGKSDFDTKNWIRIFPDAQYLPGELVTIAGIGYGNDRSIARSGLRKTEATTNAFGEFDRPIATVKEGIPTGLLQDWSGILAEWNAVNDLLLSGTLVTRIRPDARIGRRLDYTNERTDERLSFYIESVTHNFQYPGASTTTFSLTRGVRRDAGSGLKFPLLKTIKKLLEDKDVQQLKTFNLKALGDFTPPSETTRVA